MNEDGATLATVMAVVRVEDGPQRGSQHTISTFPAVVGRGRDADLRIDDPTVSRHHMKVWLDNGRIMVQGLDTTNGFVVENHLLQPNEAVAVGHGLRCWLGKVCLYVSQRSMAGWAQEVQAVLGHRPSEPTETPATLKIACLGAFRAWVQGNLIPQAAWSSRKAIALLAMLAESPQTPVPVDRIVEGLWPEDDEQSRQVLQTTVSRLRRSLRSTDGADSLKDPILHSHNAYTLVWDVDSDLLRFKSLHAAALLKRDPAEALPLLKEAVRLYGPYLLGIEDDWVQARRTWADGLARTMLENLAAYYEGKVDFESALEWHVDLLRHSPCHEPAHIGAMRCLLALGRRDEALQQYDQAVRILKQQLDLPPGAELREMHGRLLTGR